MSFGSPDAFNLTRPPLQYYPAGGIGPTAARRLMRDLDDAQAGVLIVAVD